MQVNEVTGEVTFKLAGKTYRLHAGMKRLAEYQAKLAVPGLQMTQLLLTQSDPRAIYFGLKCLCSSGNGADFDDMLLAPHLPAAAAAISAAIQAGLPEPEKGDDAGKGGATEAQS
ncbi:hypothetical protein [Taklimakanibacter deserti]|uniref:hypothetical protein n=1 Tax=Taklimakanibacter deserti TaxID=2267839 RepID=UPI000E65827B